MKKLQELYGDRFIKLHTSGHVYKEELQKMIGILKPEKGIIPIHTEDGDAFNDIACGCKVLNIGDGNEIKI